MSRTEVNGLGLLHCVRNDILQIMKSKIIVILLIILAGIGWNMKPKKLLEMKIGETTIKYETVSTAKEIELGLSYRKDIPVGQGMLFVFDQKGFRTFWMHEMMFPLDIIWIADDKIVQIDENVPIKTNGAWTVVNPNYPVDKVLELKAGEIKRLKIIKSATI